MTKVGVYSALFGLWPILAAASTPVPTYGTYFGGTGDTNAAVAVAVDSAGNVIMAGYTTSQTLPGTAHAFQPTKATGFPDNRDVFIAKFDPTGRNLLWATFLGGDGDDIPVAVAVDSSSNIYVTGTTDSTNFPLTPHAYLTTPQFAFIAKVSADGSTLLYSTFLPFDVEPIAGRYRDNALAVNGNGEAYIAGISNNLSAFVTPGALNIAGTIFLARVNSTGSGLIFGALLGGEGFNGSAVTSLTLDASGNCYLAGVTGESNVPTTSQALEGRDPNAGLPGKGIGPLNDANSGFLLEVNSTGSQILYGTYFGLRYYETSITQISLGSSGAIYFSGSTNGSAFQVTPGTFQTTPASGFIAKLTPGRATLDAFSYLSSLSGVSASPSVLFGNQPQAVYVSFPAIGSQGFELAELDVQTLGLLSSFTSPSPGFAPMSAALASLHSVWFVGSAGLGLGGLISADAYQTTPQSSGGAAVLLQLTDAPTVTVSPSLLSYAYQSGGNLPQTQTLVVSGAGEAATFTATPSSSGWLQLSDASSITPSTGSLSGTTPNTGTFNITVTANPTGLNAGTYNGSITISGTGQGTGTTIVNVTFAIAAPLPAITKVTNAASYATGAVSPGEIISIFANASSPIGPIPAVQLSGTTCPSPCTNVPTTMGGVQVEFLPSGVFAPLTYVSATQINCVVPYEVQTAANNLQVEVKYLGQVSNALGLQTAATAPGIITLDGSGPGRRPFTNTTRAETPRGITPAAIRPAQGGISPSM